jgi:hypothetical protein
MVTMATHPETVQVETTSHNGVGKGARKGVPMCTTEDDVRPCLWVANERGDRKGTSFYTDSRGKVHPINSTPRVGSVETSTGRTVKIDRNGCIVLTWPEITKNWRTVTDDPTDGARYCEN